MAVHCLVIVTFFTLSWGISNGADDLRPEALLRKDLFGYRKPIDVHTRPSVRSNQSSFIELGLSFISLEKLDFQTETLISSVWVRAVWYDYSLHWDEDDYGGINVIRISQDLIWKPDIILTNSALAKDSSAFGKALLLVYPNGQVLSVPPKTMHSSCSLELKNFPFDEHVCHWHFQSWSHDGHLLRIKYYSSQRKVDLSDTFMNSEWIVEVIDEDVEEPSDHQQITFSLRFKRRSSHYIFTLGVPIVFVWALTLVLFWLPPVAGEKITLGSFVLLYYTIFLVHLQWIIPHNGSHVPRIIVFCGHSIFFSGLSVVLAAVTVTMGRSYDSSPVPHFMRKLLTSWVGHCLCLGPSGKGVSMGAKLLRSSNVELSINSDARDDSPSVSSSLGEQLSSDWILLATAFDRLICIIYFAIFSVLVVSIFLC